MVAAQFCRQCPAGPECPEAFPPLPHAPTPKHLALSCMHHHASIIMYAWGMMHAAGI